MARSRLRGRFFSWFAVKPNRDWNRARPGVAVLEDRITPHHGADFANYAVPSQFLFDAGQGPLSAASSDAPADIATRYLNDHARDFGLSINDLAGAKVKSNYTDADTGISHVYLRQMVNGLEVEGADFAIGINKAGQVITAGGGFVPGLATSVTTATPTLAPEAALDEVVTDLALSAVKGRDGEINQTFIASGGAEQQAWIDSPFATQTVTARLYYVPTADGSAVLAWNLNVQPAGGAHWYDLGADAVTGEVVHLSDWADDAGYTVVAAPAESPQDGGFKILADPVNPLASPFGWHDTNGAAGAEFTDTRGNNVDAHLDRDTNDVADTSPPRPDGGAALNFSGYTFDAAQAATVLQNQNVAQLNLFYAINYLHDVHYAYGFTPAAGSFQTNNYGQGGAGNDAVQADAQDGGSTNNANFFTPVDGQAGRMQQYIFTSTTPTRDSDLDNGIIYHEYGHGVSNRLTGGPANSNALSNSQHSGGMGEGWGDFYALMLTQNAADTQNAAYPMGTYVLGQNQVSGAGIRRKQYSFNMTTDPLTYNAYGATGGTTSYGVTRSTEVHNTGEIWASTLWDLNWLLINKYGYNSDLSTGWNATAGTPGNAGNKLTLRLVMDGMKLQPANPSFTAARDAILAADQTLTGGANALQIWQAFARRGLGSGINGLSATSTAVTTDDFTIPASAQVLQVTTSTPAPQAVLATTPTSFTLNFTEALDETTVDAADFKVNGISADAVSYTTGGTAATFTFTTTPVTAQGIQTMAIAAGAITRASDSGAIQAFSRGFRYDATVIAVTSSSPAVGSSQAPPFTTLDLNLNEAADPLSLANVDLVLSQGYATSTALINGGTTIRFTITGVSETTLSATLKAGSFTDTAGNPSAAFSGSYTVDYTVSPFPALTQTGLAGSLAYQGVQNAFINFAGDVDAFTLNVEAGQTLIVTATPTGTAALRPTLTVTGPGGFTTTVSATAAGQIVRTTAIPITTAGVYTLNVGGVSNTQGTFALTATLNQPNEAESLGGATNNTVATAENLTGSALTLAPGVVRSTVKGRTDFVSLAEAEPNDSTATANGSPRYVSAAASGLYQQGWSGAYGSGDIDYFNIGAMQVGDVLTFTQSGLDSGRGAQTDPWIRLYRGGATSTVLAFDDDSGPGLDALVYRYTVTTADTYYIRAYRANTANTGTWQIAVQLENTGTAPTTGGTFTAEVEPNESIAAANNASAAWRQVGVTAAAAGTIGTTTDADLYAYTFAAGDLVTLSADSTSGLSPQTALLDSAGAVLTTEDGTSTLGGVGGVSTIYGYVIPAAGTYYFRVSGIGSTTGAYTTAVQLSTTAAPALTAATADYYSQALAAGQPFTVMLDKLTAGAMTLTVVDAADAVVATAVTTLTNADAAVLNYTPAAAGTYSIKLSGDQGVDYQLTTVNGTFEAESNSTLALAQPLGANRTAVGAIVGADNDFYSFAVTAGQTYRVTTRTPGDGAGEPANTLDPRLEVYNPSNVLVASDLNSAADGRNASVTFTAAATGTYKLNVAASGGTTGEYVVGAVLLVPAVDAVVVNNGAAQRSRVLSVSLDFNEAVTVAAGAVTLTRGATVLSNTPGGGLLSSASLVAGETVLVLTFDSAVAGVDVASLSDGVWTLAVSAAGVTSTATGATMLANYSTTVRRLKGDQDANNVVDIVDLTAFGNFFNSTDVAFDFDGNGVVDIADLTAFGNNFGASL